MIHCFGECELDDERFELRRQGRPAKLEPKVFDVLAYLLRHPDRVVTKAELLDEVWAGVTVSESVLPKCIAAARRAVGDTRAEPSVIRTIHGRGYRLVAAVQVRGADAPADSVAPAGSVAPADAFDASFVGRTQLLNDLRAALDEAVAGRGRTIVLLGEAGIGKTRTAEALAHVARGRGLTVLTGRAHEGDTAPAFWPWVQVLRAIGKLPDMTAWLTADAPIPPEVIAIVPELERRHSSRPPPETEAARFRLFDGVASILKRAAERRPLVLLLDDIHWADPASLHLLGFLTAGIGDAPLLVIATCRDVESERTEPVAELLRTLARAPACEWIALGGLERTDTEVLIGRLVADPPPAVLQSIHTLTAGNPFFVHELARLVAADGAQTLHDIAAMSQSPPRRVRDAIRRRLADLSPECRALLRVAAVVGQEIEPTALAAIADVAPAEALRLLSEARAAHLVHPTGELPARYAFHHALIRHALHDELDDAERVHWHRRTGEHLEERAGADPEAHLDAIAHHYLAAAADGEVERAVAACVRAATQAERVFAWEQSAGLYERALAALESAPPIDEARRVELLLALGAARSAAGERAAARDVFQRAAGLARRLGRADFLARAALGYRGPTEMGMPSDPATVALVEEALAATSDEALAATSDTALAATGDAFPVLRARLLSRMAGMPPYADRMATRARLSREALELARPSHDLAAIRDALSARLWASLGPDAIDERLAVSRELLAVGEREQSLLLCMLAHDAAFGAHLLRGHLDAATQALAAYGAAATALKQPAFLFLATFWGGSLALARGEVETAEHAFRTALARGRGTIPYAHFMVAGVLYPLRYLQGQDDDPELAAIFFGEMMALPYAFEPAVRSGLAFADWLRGEHAAAHREFDRVAVQIEHGLERDEHWLTTVGNMGRLAVLLDDAARAALLYDLLAPYADLVLVHDQLRTFGEPVDAILGQLAALLGRLDAAVAHCERAAAKATTMGARFPLIDVQAGYARVLTMRDGRGDRGRAAKLRDAARRAMADCGLRRNWLLDAGR